MLALQHLNVLVAMVFLERFRRGPHSRYSSLAAEGELDAPTKTSPALWPSNKTSMTWKMVASHVLLALLGIVIGLIWRDWPELSNGGYIRTFAFAAYNGRPKRRLTRFLYRAFR